MKEEFRISLPDRSERDWEEDFSHENGTYSNKCMKCELYFYGHKRRVICKKCYEVPPLLKFKFDPNADFTFDEWLEISKRQRPEDTKDNKAWAGAWLEGEMVGYAKCMVQKVLPPNSEDKGVQKAAPLATDNKDKVSEDIKCPFCGCDGFDRLGLKYHLIHDCELYVNTENL